MKTYDVKQGSGEWLALRLGVPTASEFDALVTPEWKRRTGQGPETYLFKKLTEKFMGCPVGTAGSFAMEQGSMTEGEAVNFFAFTYDINVQRAGFCTTDDGRIGCSPDGLIGEDGGIEIKCPQPETHLKYLVEGVVPKDYLAQVHGSMFVTGRPWWKFLSYSRQFPPLLVHVERDEQIQAAISEALSTFLTKFDATYERVKEMKDAENAIKQAAYDKSIQ